MGQEYKVIGVADIIFGFELVLYILVKLVHVDIHQKLTRKVAKRKALG